MSKRGCLDKIITDLRAFAGRPIPVRAVLDRTLETAAESLPDDDAPVVVNRVQRAILADDIEQEPVIRAIIAAFDGEVL